MNNFRKFKALVKKVPVVSGIAKWIYSKSRSDIPFQSSEQYWEERYRRKGDSGDGSYGRLADFKAEIINKFVEKESVQKVVEFGCGDGSQLALMDYPFYLGIDVSDSILNHCLELYKQDDNKQFILLEKFDPGSESFDLALSLDVVYHLVEDRVFNDYMEKLFSSSSRWVIVYSSNTDTVDSISPHVRHRKFTDWVSEFASDWRLSGEVEQKFPFDEKNGDDTSLASFYIFEKIDSAKSN